jgi:hypothetical protein
VQQARNGAITEVLLPMQHGHSCCRAGAKGAGRHLWWALSRDQGTTAATTNAMIVVGGQRGPNGGNLPHILDRRETDRLGRRGDHGGAGRTEAGIVVAHRVNLIGWWIGTVMWGMAWLPRRLAPAVLARRAWWCRWRVRGGWLGPVLGMLIQPRFQVSQALLELGDLVLELGVGVLDHLERDQFAVDKRPDGGWGGGPVGGAYACWRLIVHHGESMHATGGAVNHPCGSVSRRCRERLPHFCCFDALTIDNGNTWFWVTTFLGSHVTADKRINTVPCAIISPCPIIIPDMVPGRKIGW